ncbi:hypothetical protein PsYK624_153520 [Phanerochaete sordida]|uniref:Deoxyribonuclease NucA/NucB domain-containing protein n=1 Tax=Phanerochaete sordida TaxID=48140 RepID=A0A9P3GQP7_9APHY|nr:hypothetical protein PsYK624_153520 [Phanerochaete sordida]
MYRATIIRSLLALPALASTLAPPARAAAQMPAQICYGSPDVSCNLVFQQCLSSGKLWSSPICLAAATCAGLEPFLEALCCSTGRCLDPAREPSLDYNLYASIVGPCAWAPGGCPVQPKDFVKFYYDTLLDMGSFNLPPVRTVVGWWYSIISWTATGSQIPYKNFNDWLHYSNPSVEPQQSPHIDGEHEGENAHAHLHGHPQEMPADGDNTHQALFASLQGNSSTSNTSDPTESTDMAAHMRRAASAASSSASAAPAKVYTYHIDCNTYADVCENWCFYVFCKQGGAQAAWTVNVARADAAARRKDSQCGKLKPNKCSNKGTGTGADGKWPAHKYGYDCDEQPKASNAQGGDGSATRCVPLTENRSEGTVWKNFINGQDASQRDYLADTTAVTVVLDNPPSGALCKSLRPPARTVCPRLASASDAGVMDDLVRQQ